MVRPNVTGDENSEVQHEALGRVVGCRNHLEAWPVGLTALDSRGEWILIALQAGGTGCDAPRKGCSGVEPSAIVRRYLPDDERRTWLEARGGRVRLTYRPYDWRLNAVV